MNIDPMLNVAIACEMLSIGMNDVAKVMLNVGVTENAMPWALLPNCAVWLQRSWSGCLSLRHMTTSATEKNRKRKTNNMAYDRKPLPVSCL